MSQGADDGGDCSGDREREKDKIGGGSDIGLSIVTVVEGVLVVSRKCQYDSDAEDVV